jgi:hypothetical protein
VNPEVRFQDAMDDVTSMLDTSQDAIPLTKRGSRMHLMTWQALSVSSYPYLLPTPARFSAMQYASCNDWLAP